MGNSSTWFSVVDTANGQQKVLFDGETTKELAIGRAQIYADATIGKICVQVFRGRTIGRQIFELRRDQ